MAGLRAHRLLRQAHSKRLARMERARYAVLYDIHVEGFEYGVLMADVIEDGYLNRVMSLGMMTPVFAAVVARVVGEFDQRGLADEVAGLVSRAVFAKRVGPDGRHRLGGSDRASAQASCALARLALLDRVLKACSEVARRALEHDHRMRPAWPEAYAHRRDEPVRAFRFPGDPKVPRTRREAALPDLGGFLRMLDPVGAPGRAARTPVASGRVDPDPVAGLEAPSFEPVVDEADGVDPGDAGDVEDEAGA